MPFLIIFVGVIFVAAAVRDKLSDLTSLLKADFKGDGTRAGFFTWMIAIFALGAIGAFAPFKPVSQALLVLVVVVLLLGDKGQFFNKLQSEIAKVRS